jgi:NAD(P)-dependent dehydrogenase (short-subunit alcohol dehydrogenase family)
MAPGDGLAPADLVVFNAGNNRRVDFREVDAALFEDMWRVGCFAGFLVGREAARRLTPLGRGTVIFTGASGSLRGRAGFAQFAAAKAGLRMVAQSMAREFGPQGIHVAHVIIDGGINGERLRTNAPQRVAAAGEDGLLDIEPIAETYWQLHRQPRSAWTHEVDLRPFKESF